jgi:hypothetical protein
MLSGLYARFFLLCVSLLQNGCEIVDSRNLNFCWS